MSEKKRILILADNTGLKIHSYWLYYRSIAANELRRRITSAGHECMVIEWFKRWDPNDLKKIVDKYFEGASNPVIAISSTFDFDLINLVKIEPILAHAKSKFPNVVVIHGGHKWFKKKTRKAFKHIDFNFLSRSMGMFDDWLNDRDISQYVVDKDPFILVNNKVNRKIDTPITHQLYDDDCLTEHESLGFEIGIGCRFNCSFCDYELRNSKSVILTESEKLKKLFLDAYTKYGITNFYCLDDTANETEQKLQILYDAIKDLPYKPQISAWCRLDLLNKPKQREYFKKIYFSAVYFGIESFNPEASKFVRKKTSLDDVFNSLEFMRDECPDTFTLGSFIVGLVGDNYESIINGFERAAKEKLLDTLKVYPYELQTTGDETYTDVTSISEIEKNPEKFGYKTFKTQVVTHEGKQEECYSWTNEWTDYLTACKMANEIHERFKDRFFLLNHSEVAALRSFNLIKNKGSEEDKKNHIELQKKALQLSNHFILQYIERKKKQLGI